MTEARKTWLKKNREKLKAYLKQYRKDNKERIKKTNRAWHEAHPHKNKMYIHRCRENKRSYGYDRGG
jgi:hypothetical protein